MHGKNPKYKESNTQMAAKGKTWHGPKHPGPAVGKVKKAGKPKVSRSR